MRIMQVFMEIWPNEVCDTKIWVSWYKNLVLDEQS